MKRQLLTLAITLPTTVPAATALTIVTMAGRLGLSAVHLAGSGDQQTRARLAAAARPAQILPALSAETPNVVRINDPTVVAQVRSQLEAEGLPGPLLVAIPASIGRTMSEASARADLDPRFELGHPRDLGLFGTFEQAQGQVLALARAGADGLVLDLPLSRDVADVLAQVKALVVGATPLLVDRPLQRAVAPPRTVFYGTPNSSNPPSPR
ncbi:hypothetical protein ACLM5J_09230 [Nocardioides sp. Bht2]|uniref:hypothetical protein n=1 Tax=Nocardioides sp. Bht2 TaxID=3392297 RepID=UPI0039B691BB